MAFPGPSRRDPDHAAAQVWGAVASGLGGRLFEALRDRRSLAYTVIATSWQKARGGALLTYIATSPEREAEAREEMLVELARFTREPVADAELRQAVNYLAGQAEVSRQSGGAVAGEILEAWLAGSGLEELDDPAAPFRAVGADDVLRVAAPRSIRRARPKGWCAAPAPAGRRWRRCPASQAEAPNLRAITSAPRDASAGSRATTSTRQIPSCGSAWITTCPFWQSIPTEIPRAPRAPPADRARSCPTAPAAATTTEDNPSTSARRAETRSVSSRVD